MGEAKVEEPAAKNESEKKPAAPVPAPAPAAVPVATDGGAKKEDGGAITAIYKIDMHCEGCAKKIKRAVRHVKDVESVKADCGANKLTVIGKMDVVAVKQKLELKTKKKVELISPQPKKDAPAAAAAAPAAAEKKADEKKPEEKKAPEEKPKESTVVLKIRLHCEGCIQKIRRIILKINGVHSVDLDGVKDLVTVKGTMDVKQLEPYLKDKLKRNVEIVPPKKEEPAGEKKKEESPAPAAPAGGGEKKKEEAGGGGEKKEKEGGGGEKKEAGGGEKKEKEGGGEKKEGESKPAPPPAAEGGGAKPAEVVNKFEYYGGYPYQPLYYEAPMQYQSYSMEANPSYYYNHNYGYNNHGYVDHRYDVVPMDPHFPHHMQNDQPQMFSDENPNACSVM
ncbi:heavy metal-associated isoprenylated plant protein 3-like [Cucumis melo var. makuwa]|uniref:Heavy metal-associated isoprenylated plant protein 3-like n=1 Tax=Cucumis melo var. makuwa TaxID=1194695 RepID=A0A5D3DNF6_CUCMM|nr:heavy metal-associated isoprenylated plant protein 3-like [Cucumis melo var. makuwa]TYK25145.1 heavy metal-associated isoprenylated plant protein 3-like [Cucumis melo var. makuwa]